MTDTSDYWYDAKDHRRKRREHRMRMVAQARLIEAYERARWPRRAPTLPDILTYLMEQRGLARADLVPLLGTASRVSEVMNGKRGLSMTMVRRLRERFTFLRICRFRRVEQHAEGWRRKFSLFDGYRSWTHAALVQIAVVDPHQFIAYRCVCSPAAKRLDLLSLGRFFRLIRL